MIRFKYNKLTNRWAGDDKSNGDHYVIVEKLNGVVQTFQNGELVDDRSSSIRDAKRNINEYLEVAQ